MDAPFDFRGKRVTVAGLGHFGGGVAVARWLVAQGASVLVTDKAPADKLIDATSQLAGLPIAFRLGGHDETDFTTADVVVASPALPPTNEYLQAARNARVPVTTEIRLFVERCRAPVVGVTGSKGKSTTSAMLAAMLRKKFTVWFGGNIGKSLLDDLPDIRPDHVVILELSSFMLRHLDEAKWSPHVGVLTLLVPDHLDWHGSYETYVHDKLAIFRHQKPGDVAVVNSACQASFADSAFSVQHSAFVPYAADTFPAFTLNIPGVHNQLNAQGAFAAAGALGVSWDDAQAALRDFQPLPHRLQTVHESAGVRWVNDSIATVPEAAVAALESFPAGRVIQIVGGASKGLDVSVLVAALASRAKAVLTIGKTGSKFAWQLLAAGAKAVHDCDDLRAAVPVAKRLAEPGDVVLLSPGFASYDQFANFEARGEAFAKLARETDEA